MSTTENEGLAKPGEGKEAVDAYDAKHGKSECNVPRTGNEEALLPTVAMPKAPDPSPFALGGGK